MRFPVISRPKNSREPTLVVGSSSDRKFCHSGGERANASEWRSESGERRRTATIYLSKQESAKCVEKVHDRCGCTSRFKLCMGTLDTLKYLVLWEVIVVRAVVACVACVVL
jgi:hypothetical protein